MSYPKEITKGVIEAILLQTLKDHGESYGYQLLQALQQKKGTILSFQEGTLYPLLYRLEARKMVTSQEKEATSGKKRRYYRLTKKGESYLEERRLQFASLYAELERSLHLSL